MIEVTLNGMQHKVILNRAFYWDGAEWRLSAKSAEYVRQQAIRKLQKKEVVDFEIYTQKSDRPSMQA
jgi:hypothetical protein